MFWFAGFIMLLRLHRAIGGIEQQIAIDPHVEAIADGYLHGRLDVQIASRHLCADLREVSGGSATGDLAGTWIREDRAAPGLR